MRLFIREEKGESRLCVASGDKYMDVEELTTGREEKFGLKDLIADGDALEHLKLLCEQADEDRWLLLQDVSSFKPPLPDGSKIVCIASNYRAHIAESGREAPDVEAKVTPRLFLKPKSCLTGHGGRVELPRDSVAVDWEIELGVVIGRRAKRISAEDASHHIFGYTVFNDITERKFDPGQRTHTLDFDRFFDWQHGKWHDTFAPCGPTLVTADEVADPGHLNLGLRLNDELMQEGNTSEMIVGIYDLIAFVSRVMTLEPGDLIATGTPSGVGNAKGIFLKPGDRLEGWVEGVGTLRNEVVAEEGLAPEGNEI